MPTAAAFGADAQLTIPMRPPVDSLNVAIAAALILYEASRQRKAH
jgi:TrmH family RNA methyltransferase